MQKIEDTFSEKKKIIILIFLYTLMVITAVVAMACGVYDIGIIEVYKIIVAHLIPFRDIAGLNKLHNTVIWKLRVPRIVLAVNVGCALATAGAVFQGCFRNPLVEPYILGVSSGAAFGAALGIVFPAFFLSVQTSAFLFSLAAVMGTYMLARIRGETPTVTLILSGVIVGSVFSALVSILKYIAHQAALREIVFWLMGGFYYASWRDIWITTPLIGFCFVVIWCLGWKLNILSMGDEEARTLDVSPEKYNWGIGLTPVPPISCSITIRARQSLLPRVCWL